MVTQSDEVVLVKKARSGSQKHYEVLIRRYARLVWSVVYGIVEDPTCTEDVVQETFMKAWEMINQLREPENFKAWLLTIARRNALQYHETMQKQGQIKQALASRPEATSGRGSTRFDGAAQSSEDLEGLREQLHSALRQLPERYKVPLTLRYLEGFDYKKISGLLGLTDGALRGLLNRGMKALREEVKSNKHREMSF